MVNRGEHIAGIARAWIGTPYVHQATTRGAGSDCLGLLRGVWRELFGPEPVHVPAYTRDWSEPGQNEQLWGVAQTIMDEKPISAHSVGDVILFRMRTGSVAKHLGIVGALAPNPTFIHAYTGHGVVESPLSAPWARRIVACFAFPERTK